MEISGLHFIGRERSGSGEVRFQAVDPATSEKLEGEFFEAAVQEVERAVELASAAQSDHRFQDPPSRADLLRRIARGIEELGQGLIRRAVAETGLPSARLEGERGRTAGQLRMFADLVEEGSWVDARIDRANPGRKPIPKPDLRRMLVPIGPVVVFGASNFPLAFSVAGGDTASALAGGNPVIVKAHPAHPGTSELVASVIMKSVWEAGMAEGVFSMLQGKGNEVGLSLVSHPAVRAVGFTGSLKGGRALFDAAVRRAEPIPVFAEMGSVNPVFLLPEALRSRAVSLAEGLAQSVMLGVGQFCTNPGLVAGLKGDGWDQFLEKLERLVHDAQPGTMLHCGIRDAFERGIDSLLSINGVRLLSRAQIQPDARSTQVAPAVLLVAASSFIDRPLLDEVFGPVTVVIECENSTEQLKVAEALNGQLTGTIHGTGGDVGRSAELIRTLRDRVGRLVFNGFPTGVEVCQSMHHGGPYPATTDSRGTSVGTAAISRFARPLCYQDAPAAVLPSELMDDNPRGIWRLVDGERSRNGLSAD